MYNVSSAYLSAMDEPTAEYKLKIKLDGTDYTGDILVGGSFSINNQCSDTDIVQIGSVYCGVLKMTIYGDQIERGRWKGVPIIPSEGLKIGNTYEYVPLGRYRVEEANHVENGVQITAYDNMLKFDKSFNLSTTNGQPYNILQLLCQDCGVTLGNTEEQIRAMANGTQTISLYSENDCETYRDVVFWLAQTLAAFATIGRDGKLYLRQYADGHGAETADIDEYHRFEGSSFSDFVTEYSGVSYVDIESQETKYITDGLGDDKLTYNLGANPFMQYGTESTRKQMALNILAALRKIYYVPFKTEYLNTPAYDLGDIVVNEGGIGNGSISCIMAFEYNYTEGIAVEGFGQNPLLATARNKVDKDIAGLMSKTDKNAIQFYTFKNAEIIAVSNRQTRQVMNIRFATAETKQVVFQAEILCDAFTSADEIKAKVKYYLDEVLIDDYIPVETWDENGKHIISLYYMIDVEPNTLYKWQVFLEVEGGSIVVYPEQARGTIWGQGLVATDKWNGFIDLEDQVTALSLDSISVATFTATASASAQIPASRSVEDTIGGIALDSIAVAPMNDIVILNKTSLYIEGLKWNDVKEMTWGGVYDEHTW